MRIATLSSIASLAGAISAAPAGDQPAPAASSAPAAPPRVHIKNGTLIGTHLPEFDQDAFLGVPYAQPPTGNLRFMAPAPLKRTWKSKNVKNYGPSCYWSGAPDVHDNSGLRTSEDCLTVNVVRPSNQKRRLPVFVYVHGGDFQHGSSGRDLFNMSYPIKQSVDGATPVIGVSFNYRLGGFGFLSTSGAQGTTNNGLRDQRMAFQWVKENIAQFGGDPNKITLWGEGAGAISISHQMVAYNGRNDKLFNQAIFQSGFPGTVALTTLSDGQKQYSETVRNANCANNKDTFKCLQQMRAEKLNKVFKDSGIRYLPLIDNDVFNSHPTDAIKKDRINAVPSITGNTEDEGTFPAFSLGEADNEDELVANLTTRYPALSEDMARRLIDTYPDDPAQGSPYGTEDEWATDFGGQWKRGNSIGGDIAIHAPRRMFAHTLIKKGKQVYGYMWNQTNENIPPQMGATHKTDLVYGFANPTPLQQSRAGIIGQDDDQHRKWKLAELFSRMMMSFVATGDPNRAKTGGPHALWPKYSKEDSKLYYFNSDGSRYITDNYRYDAIEMISKNYEKFRN